MVLFSRHWQIFLNIVLGEGRQITLAQCFYWGITPPPRDRRLWLRQA